jgi:hypothetical protein
MIKNSIHSNGFTNDIDMVMVSTNKKANWKHNLLLEFLEGLRATFPYFTWSYDISTNHIVDDDIYLNKLPELVKIKLNGTKIFDVTYYDESHGDELKKQNMFRYAIKTLYNSDESGYYSKLRRLHPLRNLDPKNLEKLTITNLQIERLSLIKGLENQDYLLKNGISTANEKRDILHKLIGDETDSKKISSFNRKINRLETKYVDTSAIHKRVARYNKKLSIIDKMLK